MINTLVFISFAITLDIVANFMKMKEIGLPNGTESFIGSILVLWVAVEATDTEINYLEGKSSDKFFSLGIELVSTITINKNYKTA